MPVVKANLLKGFLLCRRNSRMTSTSRRFTATSGRPWNGQSIVPLSMKYNTEDILISTSSQWSDYTQCFINPLSLVCLLLHLPTLLLVREHLQPAAPVSTLFLSTAIVSATLLSFFLLLSSLTNSLSAVLPFLYLPPLILRCLAFFCPFYIS